MQINLVLTMSKLWLIKMTLTIKVIQTTYHVEVGFNPRVGDPKPPVTATIQN